MKVGEIFEDISARELGDVERFADSLWHHLGVDVKFTKHFLDRVNDERNQNPITVDELIALFKKEFYQYGRHISDLEGNSEAVMKDLLSKVNLPFVMNDRGRDKQLVAKTVMRKPNFKTSSQEFAV
jgi:hypothetical protein